MMASSVILCTLLITLAVTFPNIYAHALPGYTQDAFSSSAENQIVMGGGGGGGNEVKPRAHVPKYMLELYENMKVRDRTEIADVVRSYSSVNGVNVFTRYDNDINNREQQLGSKTRIHTLVFNVSSLPEHEKLEKAELRLYALIRRDQHTYSGVSRQVTLSTCQTTHLGGSECESIETRQIHETASAWETFIITPAVRDWLENGRNRHPEQRLEIQISSILSSDSGDVDFPMSPHSDTEPLLLVYSSDRRHSSPPDDNNETSNDIFHALRRRSADIEDVEEESNSIFDTEPSLPRVAAPGRNVNGRKRHRNPCRRRALYVNFADINYDTWIIAPSGYEAYECTGKCYFPLSDHLTPTKHAIVQTLLHTVSPRKTSRACCVPTRLSPISVLYVDDEGVVTYKFHYDDMVVAECGCR